MDQPQLEPHQVPFSVETQTLYEAACGAQHENNISTKENLLLYSRTRCPVIRRLDQDYHQLTFLLGHTDEVNGLCFVQDSQKTSNQFWVISSAYDNTAIIWFLDRTDNGPLKYHPVFRLESPNQSTFITRCCLKRNNSFVSVTTNLDGFVHLWNDDQLLQTIQTKYYSFYAHLFTLEANLQFSSPLDFLFLAGSDNKIHIFQIIEGKSLKFVFDLSGHNDWIKCLDTRLINQENEFLLASASQDAYIRVWHMRIIQSSPGESQVRTVVSDTLHASGATGTRLTATLETILAGHENIVHSLCWFKKCPQPQLQLASCSADKTIVLWNSKLASQTTNHDPDQVNQYDQQPASSETWKEYCRLGETGETNLPFLAICLSDDETTLFGLSLHGAIHSWQCHNFELGKWLPSETITGHFEPVTDLAWELSRGAYLLSSSLDKTCRLHAWLPDKNQWRELGRPQVHGHEINCVTSLGFSRFATGAEEKTIRAFEATRFSLKSLLHLCKLETTVTLNAGQLEDLPLHAQLPALGLSNKAAQSPYDLDSPVDEKGGGQSTTWYSVSKLVKELAQIEYLERPPTEEILLQSTLWWEASKLFGHSNEIYGLATSTTGSHLASASKANRADLAKIFLWDVSRLRKVGTIEHHSLTITRLRFSPDCQYLLSVSRDRTWALSKQSGQLRDPYELYLGTCKGNAIHERIIWDCTWTWDGQYFITVSRDKKAIVWSLDKLCNLREYLSAANGDQHIAEVEKMSACTQSVEEFHGSIQAVDSPDFDICKGSTHYLLAMGFENGAVELHVIRSSDWSWQMLANLERLHLGLPIRRLAFRPKMVDNLDGQLCMASAGDDCVVRLTRLSFIERSRVMAATGK